MPCLHNTHNHTQNCCRDCTHITLIMDADPRAMYDRSYCMQDPLRTQPSGISEGGLGRPMSELDINMDDLLGLNESPFEANKADPFRVKIYVAL